MEENKSKPNKFIYSAFFFVLSLSFLSMAWYMYEKFTWESVIFALSADINDFSNINSSKYCDLDDADFSLTYEKSSSQYLLNCSLLAWDDWEFKIESNDNIDIQKISSNSVVYFTN